MSRITVKTGCRLYRREKARGGIALTMTAGSAVASLDSPAAFGNLRAYDDRIVPHMRALAKDCHAEGCAMMQLTHLGRRTACGQGDWLPVLTASSARGAIRLYRIGDAVTSRNVHAAIYDALRFGSGGDAGAAQERLKQIC